MTWPSIPQATNDPNSLFRSVQALKQTVEIMTGMRGDQRLPVMKVGTDQPAIDKEGDFWLCPKSDKTTLNVAVGGKWLIVGTLT